MIYFQTHFTDTLAKITDDFITLSKLNQGWYEVFLNESFPSYTFSCG